MPAKKTPVAAAKAKKEESSDDSEFESESTDEEVE